MITLETVAKVTVEGELVVKVPAGIPPGEHRVVIVVDTAPEEPAKRDPLHLPAYPVGPASPSLTFRREDIYGDDGR